MENRREFLKAAVTGAVVLSSESTLAAAAAAPKPRVVVARDNSLNGAMDERKVLALLDKAMASYTGRKNPVEAWKHVIPANILAGKTIGLKVNGLGGRGISTHAALIHAVCERLQQAGVKAGNIIVWDRNARDLAACGMTLNTSDQSKVRCIGSDVAGYEDHEEQWGTARIKLAKLLTRECEMVIGLPILKDHEMAGITFAMKNMYGVVDHPDHLHANKCNPAVADLNCIPAIRAKVRLTIGDALTSVCQGGPVFHPEHLWYPNALVVGEDRVAVDHVAWQLIEGQRKAKGLPNLAAAGREPKYIAVAADALHRLGTNDPQRMHLMEV
ncbi:MAG: DUF362 domain-containing protein [Terracidiphilus sp.]|nr:DUF362 domain-containing protein [Terracidiphilus sp.]